MTEISINDAAVGVAPRMTAVLALRDTGGIARRNLLRILRTPQMLLIGAIQPAMILVLFGTSSAARSGSPGVVTSTTSSLLSFSRRSSSAG